MVGGGWFAAEAQQEGGSVCKQGNRQEMAKPGDQTPSTRSYKETRERRREIEDGIKMVWRGRREKVQEQAMATPESERLDGNRVPVQLTIGNRVGVSRMHQAHTVMALGSMFYGLVASARPRCPDVQMSVGGRPVG